MNDLNIFIFYVTRRKEVILEQKMTSLSVYLTSNIDTIYRVISTYKLQKTDIFRTILGIPTLSGVVFISEIPLKAGDAKLRLISIVINLSLRLRRFLYIFVKYKRLKYPFISSQTEFCVPFQLKRTFISHFFAIQRKTMTTGEGEGKREQGKENINIQMYSTLLFYNFQNFRPKYRLKR